MTHTGFTPTSRVTNGASGFWIVAFAFGTAMAFTTVPTPLWSLYAQRDGFSSLTGIFLAAYTGLAGPVIGLGALTQTASMRVSLLVFAALLALGILPAAPALLGASRSHRSSQPQPTSP